METHRLTFVWIICFCLHPQIAADLDIVDVNAEVTIDSKGSGRYLLSMDENNHNFVNQTSLFKIQGAQCSDITVRFLSPNKFDYIISTDCIFISMQSFDYENEDERKYTFGIGNSIETSLTVQFNINNIDDEKPTLGSPQCHFDENKIYTSENSTCKCLLKDADGFLSKMVFSVFSTEANEREIFELALPDDLEDTIYQADVTLNNIKELDYETIRFYSFSISVEDSGHNVANQSATVDVIDQRDTNPTWIFVVRFADFPEETPQEFNVSAIDGDTGINSEICYYKIEEDDPKENYITIDEKLGHINVGAIDRDKDDINLYNFSMKACVCDDVDWCTSQLVNFYIQDIDDNSPLILFNNYTNGSTVPFDDTKEEVIELSFLENYAGSFNFTTFIKDIDTGENAQFHVDLYPVNDESIDYTAAFMVVPTAGYRNGDYTISVKNSTLLDFENPDWQYIQFHLMSNGIKDHSRINKTLVNITLEDYNDEFPKFAHDQYEIKMLETVKTGDKVKEVRATDLDAVDKVLRMEILGSYAKNRLSIDSDGQITVNLMNGSVFDYDILNSIFFQVRATDHADHSTTVPVTIMLIDVNNKPPIIDPIDPVKVEENQKDGAILNVTIRATDPYITADLTAKIDWDKSYATKNSRILDMKNETIRNIVKFLEVEISPPSGDGFINLLLLVADSDGTKPDFETFDSLYLNLVVINRNIDEEFKKNDRSSATILISIIDINDNDPYFVEDNSTNRTVPEQAQKGISVGYVVAVDPDISDNVTISCTAIDTSADWVYLDSNNGFIVRDYNQTNADDPLRYYFNYSCIANDGIHNSTALEVPFYIIDTNNEIPQIIDLNDIVDITEKSPTGTVVVKMNTTDLDRDAPFNTVNCTLTPNTECFEEFNMLPDDNTIVVRTGGENLDRDHGRTNFVCSVTCRDNINGERAAGSLSIQQEFTINLLDKNDNSPILITKQLECDEYKEKDDLVGEVIASDIDEGINADIDFSIVNIKDEKTGDDFSSLFRIDQTNGYEINETFKQAHLYANKDLRGFYGEYIINLLLKDRGTPTQTNDKAKIMFKINKFNFNQSVIVFPTNNSKSISLSTIQEPGKPLKFLRNNGQLKDFEAKDGETNDCSKWNVTFDIKPNNYRDDNIFRIIKLDSPCSSQLQINKNFEYVDVTGKIYEIEVLAWSNSTYVIPKAGEASYLNAVNISIMFLENNLQPEFDVSSWTLNFHEANTTESQQLEYLPTYQDGGDYSIYYDLVPVDDDNSIEQTFKVNKTTGTISVMSEFFCDDVTRFYFRIVASSDDQHISQNPKSRLDVTVDVTCINRRYPQFNSNSSFGAIMPGYTSGYPVLSIEASDPDSIDKGHLTFNISSNIVREGNGIFTINDPPFDLTLGNDSAKVVSTFEVEGSMSGYFKFEVTVTDQQDELGHGPFSNSTNVTIFIITSDNTVDFRFYNNISEVEQNKNEMLKIVEQVVQYETYCKSIEISTEDNVNYTKASLYFIKREGTSTGISLQASETILKIVGNVNTFSTLATELKTNLMLYLYSFPSQNNANSEAVLRAWLTGVSITMTLLSCILLIILMWKTRQLNRRISKLTTKKFGSQDSGLNRLGVSAPTTNKHAIEGSNPVYRNEEKEIPEDMSDFDKHSMRSGDSDLIGIENNPEFDYNFNSLDANTHL